MGLPLKLTEKQIDTILAEIKEKLLKQKTSDGAIKIDYKVGLKTNLKANIIFSSVAYAKMMTLIRSFDSEVAWHGTVTRDGNNFTINDIIVYPQEVTGATVNTDQAAYETWLMGLDDEVFNTVRMQGHSHVNMSVSPSGVDEEHQEKILDQLDDGDYYIFIIGNKRMDIYAVIYDMQNNVMFGPNDIEIYIGGQEFNHLVFLEQAKGLVKHKTTTSYKSFRSATTAASSPSENAKSSTGGKNKKSTGKKNEIIETDEDGVRTHYGYDNRRYGYYDDDDYDYDDDFYKQYYSYLDRYR